jgi:chromatin assembly factor 1 subunit B
MLVSSDGYCTVVVFDEHMSHYQTQQRDLQLRSVALAHSHSLITTTAPHPSSSHPSQHHPSFSSSYSTSTGAQSPLVHPSPSPFVPPHAPSPAVSLKELPGPSGHSSVVPSVVPIAPALVSTSYSSGVKRPASSFDPPLTPAASVMGGDVDLAMGPTAGLSTENERDTVEEGPAKKRRRVELQHHGAV